MRPSIPTVDKRLDLNISPQVERTTVKRHMSSIWELRKYQDGK
jgi:hypothetical protein